MDTPNLLNQAMEQHQKGDLEKAEDLYRKALKSGLKDKKIFSNLAAILRSQGNPQEAAIIANNGLDLCDANSPILLNTLGNALRDLQRYPEAINTYRRAIKNAPNYFDPKISLLVCLSDAGYAKLAYLCLRSMLNKYGASNRGLVDQLIKHEVKNATSENRDLNSNIEKLLGALDENTISNQKLPEHWFSMSQMCCKHDKIKEAISFYNKGVKSLETQVRASSSPSLKSNARQLHTISSWNFSCALVRYGNFELGWKLYEYGLQTPANSKQRWQRSLYKPFSFSKLRLWRGEHLKDMHILLLGEQGIGDSMMFISLIPKLLAEEARITIIVPFRLYKIYKRSLPNCTIISDQASRKNPPDHTTFDYQCPLGSIVQHRFKSLKDFENRDFSLISEKQVANDLRRKYLDKYENKKIIGISWQGGGTKDRINDKSIGIGKLLKTLSKHNFRILSLQYGDDAEIVSKNKKSLNVDFIDDPEIQATKDMNQWLNQVEACDAVISIANTTIHGAGGLNKPTLCLLGRKSDWRWLKDRSERKSYWYPSVSIAWQEEDGCWDAALKMIDPWLKANKLT